MALADLLALRHLKAHVVQRHLVTSPHHVTPTTTITSLPFGTDPNPASRVYAGCVRLSTAARSRYS